MRAKVSIDREKNKFFYKKMNPKTFHIIAILLDVLILITVNILLYTFKNNNSM